MPKAEDASRAIEIFQGYERWTEECDKVCEAPNKKGRGAGWKDMAAPQKDTKLITFTLVLVDLSFGVYESWSQTLNEENWSTCFDEASCC